MATQRLSFIEAHFVITINLKVFGFDAIELLISEKTFVSVDALRYHKHLSTSLIAVGDIIIYRLIIW